MWRLNKSSLLLAIIVYCYVPILIFLLGWVKYYVSVPTTLLLLYFLWKFYKENRCKKDSVVNIHWGTLCIISILLMGLCLVCGYGGFVTQASDWIKHNAILQDLYTHSWPVIYNIEGEPALLTYYHALYLFPALLGKIFQNHQVVEISFGLVGFIGLWLMVMSIIIITQADKWYKQITVVIGFIAFSGLLFPLQKVCHFITGDPYCNNWHAFPIGQHLLQYRSIFVMLRRVGPQCFIAWLCLVLFWEYKNDLKWYSIIALPALLSGTWAFLGLVIIMLYYITITLIHKPIVWKEILTLSNIIPAIVPGIPFALYLLNNKVIEGEGVSNNEFGITMFYGSEWVFLILFYIFIYGVYTIVLWYENRKDVLFYAIPISLICIPFFSIGSEIDFVMGVSIPAIILLFFYIARSLVATNSTGSRVWKTTFQKCLIIIFLLLGVQYPYAEFKSVIDSHSWHLKNDYTEQSMDICFRPDNKGKPINILWENYVNIHLSDNLYYKYISK